MKVRTINSGSLRSVRVGELLIGESSPTLIAGPCAVESESQIYQSASLLKAHGVKILRGGVFKPRTNPYDFQGLGSIGLDYLNKAARDHDMYVITEVMSESELFNMYDKLDIIQIGSRNMYNYPLLKLVGEQDKPVLLKRGFSATIDEWIMAAEHIASRGNENIIFCERGIRSFGKHTRNTLDLCAVPIIKELTGLPVIVDPSHGTGVTRYVKPMSKAALACGADGLMIEVHPEPHKALCDGQQSLNPSEFANLVESLKR